jgi:hypothetical protein
MEMVAPNSRCEVCGSEMYVSPGHKDKGWGKTCSFECRSKYKPNPRFIENDVECKRCGKEFHVKPSRQRLGKARSYCSDECRVLATTSQKECAKCGSLFQVPKCHEDKTKFCSKECQKKSYMSSTHNCYCPSCGKAFYTKPSEIKRGIGAGTFCSVKCMTGGRSKVKLSDGKHASSLEVLMMQEIVLAGLCEGMIREHAFHDKRKWRIDFAWPERKIGVEVHGGIWQGKSGGHTSGKGRMRDMEKMNEAKILGWKIIEVCSEHIKSGKAIEWLLSIMDCDK